MSDLLCYYEPVIMIHYDLVTVAIGSERGEQQRRRHVLDGTTARKGLICL